MKKSSILLLGLFLLLSITALYLFKFRDSSSSIASGDRDFLVKDTASISRIFLADKEGHSAEIRREKDGWYVNGKYKCRSEAVLNLLEAIRLVEVKMPVPKTAKANVLRFMSSNAVKIEIYSGEDKIKQYYVGHEPPDSEGSYLLLSKGKGDENYPDPYVCFIPGFKGILQPRFITNENEWRDRLVLNFIPPELTEIRLNYNFLPADSSFSIKFLSASEFKLYNGSGKELSFDMGRMRQYLIYFQNISYESLITDKSSRLLDSLRQNKAFAELRVLTKKGETKEYRFYRKAFTGEFNPELGIAYKFDPDRLFMNFDNGKEWALIQYFVFGKLLITDAYFRPPVTVKK